MRGNKPQVNPGFVLEVSEGRTGQSFLPVNSLFNATCSTTDPLLLYLLSAISSVPVVPAPVLCLQKASNIY